LKKNGSKEEKKGESEKVAPGKYGRDIKASYLTDWRI
jgi:hypothetical protein